MNRQERRHPERFGARPLTPTEKVMERVLTRVEVGVFAEPEERIVLGWCTAGDLHNDMAISVITSFMHDRVYPPMKLMGFIGLQSGPRIVEARSMIVEKFLFDQAFTLNGNDHPGWLLMVDSDMVFDGDAIFQLRETARQENAHIVGGLCFAGIEGRIVPTVYRLTDEAGMVEPVFDYPRDAVCKVGATGAAFLLMSREVLLAMRTAYAKLPNGEDNPHPWFVEGRRNGYQWGEDISFCLRAQRLGYGVYVDTRVKVGHKKSLTLDERSFDAERS